MSPRDVDSSPTVPLPGPHASAVSRRKKVTVLDDSPELAPGITLSTFFRDYWQQKALLMPGMAEYFVGPLMDYPEASSIMEAARLEGTVRLSTDPGRTEFLRGADCESPRLAARALALQEELGLPRLTFDVVLTHGAGGIGCHYDDTDNFVIQNAGTKHWQLGPVDALPDADRRRRLLRHEGYDWRAFLPHEEDVISYELKAGDVLYVPVGAPHWGTAREPSISTPLVFNVHTSLEELLPCIQDVLEEDPAWWGPAPAAGRPPGEEELGGLLGSLQTQEFGAAVLSRWRAQRSREQAVHRPRTQARGSRGEPALGAVLTLELAPLKSILAVDAAVDVSDLLAVSPATTASLDRLVAARNLHRALRLVVSRTALLDNSDDIVETQRVMTWLGSVRPDALRAWLMSADLTSWLGVAQREEVSRYRRQPDTVLAELLVQIIELAALESDVPLEGPCKLPALIPDIATRLGVEPAGDGRFDLGDVSVVVAGRGSRPTWVDPSRSPAMICRLPQVLRDAVMAPPTRMELDDALAGHVGRLGGVDALIRVGADTPTKSRPVAEFRGLFVVAGSDPLVGTYDLLKACGSVRYSDYAGSYKLSRDASERIGNSRITVADALHQAFVSAWLRRAQISDLWPVPPRVSRSMLDRLAAHEELTARGRELVAAVVAVLDSEMVGGSCEGRP